MNETPGVIDTTSRTHTRPPYSLWIVPLPRTNGTKYVHTFPVIRTDKAYFVRQFNRTKYPCKGCYFAITYNA